MEKYCEQFEKTTKNLKEVKSEDDSSHSQSTDEELLTDSLFSVGSTLSLCSICTCTGSLSGSSPCEFEKALTESTENTYQERYASCRPLLDSSAKLQAQFDGISSREDHHHTKNVVAHDGVEQNYQEFKQSEQLNCTCSCCQKNNIGVSQLLRFNDVISATSIQVQDEIAAYQDCCRKQEDEINNLIKILSQMEEEKQGLEAEVGRQIFLESKEKRRNVKIFQQSHGDAHVQSKLATATSTGRGASHDGGLLCGPGSMDRSGRLLQYRIQEISDLLSKSEIERIKNLVTPIVDLDRPARIRKCSELFKELEYKGELSCYYVKCLLETIHQSDLAEKLVAPFHNSDELFKRECHSPQERNQGYEAPERIFGVDDRTSNEGEASGEISKSADIDEEFYVGNPSGSSPNPGNSNSASSLVDINYADSSSGRCGLASRCSQSTSTSNVSVESLTEDSYCGTPTISLNYDHNALKARENSVESTFDTTIGGDEKQVRSVSLSLTEESFESGEVKGWSAAKVEGGKEDLNSSSSICDGAVNGSYLIQHCNIVGDSDGPGCTSSRAQDSFKLKNVSGVSQDSLSPESMPLKQNVSHATISAQKGAVHVLSDSCVSNQLNTWEHVGAGPINATQKQHVKGTVVQGVVNTFLARHSEDKHLHESLYYNNAEEMLAKDACMVSMMNMIDSHKAKPYLGDCQVDTRSDPFSQPYSSVFPLANEVYARANGEDGFPLSDNFNGNYLVPPGPSYSCIGANTSQNCYFNSFNSNFLGGDFPLDTSEPPLLQDGHFTPLQRSDFLQSGFTGSGLTSDFLGTTGPQVTHSLIVAQSNIGFTGTTSILPPEPLQMQTPSTTNLGCLASSSGNAQIYGNQPNGSGDFPASSLVVRAIGSDRRLLPWLESSRNTHLSPVSSVRDSVNTSGHKNSNSTSNTNRNYLTSGTFRKGDRAGNSISSGLTSGANRGEDHQEEWEIEMERRLQRATFVQESLDSTHNSSQQLEQDVRDAWLRALANNPHFGRRGRKCADEEKNCKKPE